MVSVSVYLSSFEIKDHHGDCVSILTLSPHSIHRPSRVISLPSVNFKKVWIRFPSQWVSSLRTCEKGKDNISTVNEDDGDDDDSMMMMNF